MVQNTNQTFKLDHQSFKNKQVKLTPQQYALLKKLPYQLQAVEEHGDKIHFAILKQRYFKIIKTDDVTESLLECDFPIVPKPVLTFSAHRHYPIQMEQLNTQQIKIVQAFLVQWQNLNQ